MKTLRAVDRGHQGVQFVDVRPGPHRVYTVPLDAEVTVTEASRCVEPIVTRMAVHKWIKSGKLPARVHCGCWVIKLDDLKRFVAQYGKGWVSKSAGTTLLVP